MKTIKIAVAVAILATALPMPIIATSASAATAHNSQAGGSPGGSTTNVTKPTGRHMKMMKRTKHMKRAM